MPDEGGGDLQCSPCIGGEQCQHQPGALTGRGHIQRTLGDLGKEGVWVIWHDRDKRGRVSKGRFRRGDRRESGEQRSWRNGDSLVGQGEVQEPGA